MDVQSVIENPELYLMGTSRTNDEQVGYVETRTK